MRKALGSLQFVDKNQPIYVDITTKRAAFTLAAQQQFDADQTLKALREAGFPDATVIKKPG